MRCFVKQWDGVPIPWSVGWLCSRRAVVHLLAGLPMWRAPVKAFSIDHVAGAWRSGPQSLHVWCCGSIAAFTGWMLGTSVVLTVALKSFSVQASLVHLPQVSWKAFMLPHLWDVAEERSWCGDRCLGLKCEKHHSCNLITGPRFQTVWMWLLVEDCYSHLDGFPRALKWWPDKTVIFFLDVVLRFLLVGAHWNFSVLGTHPLQVTCQKLEQLNYKK